MGYVLSGVKNGSVPVDFIKEMQEVAPIKYFIESGTAGADSIRDAAPLFKECHTIEIMEGTVTGGVPSNATFYIGDSSLKLSEVLHKLDGTFAFFWLDAHYSGNEPNTSGVKECPVLDEIKAISGYKNSIILIDDARLFLGMPPWPLDPREWPTIENVFSALRQAFPDHYITLMDDYVLCCHPNFRDAVNREWRARYKLRYPDAPEKLKTQAQDVWKAIQEYLK